MFRIARASAGVRCVARTAVDRRAAAIVGQAALDAELKASPRQALTLEGGAVCHACLAAATRSAIHDAAASVRQLSAFGPEVGARQRHAASGSAAVRTAAAAGLAGWTLAASEQATAAVEDLTAIRAHVVARLSDATVRAAAVGLARALRLLELVPSTAGGQAQRHDKRDEHEESRTHLQSFYAGFAGVTTDSRMLRS
jgi:hypothetical protein